MISKEVPKEYYRYSGQGQYTTEYREGQSTGRAESGAQGQTAQVAEQPAAQPEPQQAPAEPAAEDMTLYTKYDFIPGDKVIYYDDLSAEEEAEFPFRWTLDRGVFEIARMGGEFWILCTDEGQIMPKIPAGPLPEKYTVEMDVFMNDGNVSLAQFYIYWLDAKGKSIGYFLVRGNSGTNLSIQGKTLADKSLPEKFSYGPHTMRIMATSRSIKCFMDEVRVANVPTSRRV